jgi:hypothetical protein
MNDLPTLSFLATMGFLISWYAVRHELAALGLPTGGHILRIWRQYRSAPRKRLMLRAWAVLMWIFCVCMFVVVPFMVVQTYRILAGTR